MVAVEQRVWFGPVGRTDLCMYKRCMGRAESAESNITNEPLQPRWACKNLDPHLSLSAAVAAFYFGDNQKALVLSGCPAAVSGITFVSAVHVTFIPGIGHGRVFYLD